MSVSRELTKKFEQTVRGSLAEVVAHFEAHPPKGEFVMIVEGCDAKHTAADNDDSEPEEE